MTTPQAELGWPAPDFDLPGVDGRRWRLADCRGEHGTLVMFICNHCPYVQAILDRIIRDACELAGHGVRCVAISANDPAAYPEDSFDNMVRLAKEKDFPFPYLFDASQDVARAYGAVCTPDFFGFDAGLRLRYRGRLDESRKELSPAPGESCSKRWFRLLVPVRGRPSNGRAWDARSNGAARADELVLAARSATGPRPTTSRTPIVVA
ncbi:MAG: thioredoxin family protein [Halothiobacillaceae bacterium]